MPYQQLGPSKFYALLIGINYYLSNALPHGSYQGLEGCARDITEVERFLKSTLDLLDTQIVASQEYYFVSKVIYCAV